MDVVGNWQSTPPQSKEVSLDGLEGNFIGKEPLRGTGKTEETETPARRTDGRTVAVVEECGVPDVGDGADDEKMGSIEKVFESSPKILISTPSKHSRLAKAPK